jgi:hypothetical protein
LSAREGDEGGWGGQGERVEGIERSGGERRRDTENVGDREVSRERE